MTSLTKPPPIEIKGREQFTGDSPGFSGATFERALTGDGRRVILKHLPAEGDWITRATNGVGRARLLWDSGLLHEVGNTVEHTVIGMLREDDHDVVVMEDVSEILLPSDVRLPVPQVDRVLAGLARLHGAFERRELDGLCRPADRHSLFLPAIHRTDDGPNPCPPRDFLLAGWEAFAEQWPVDIVDAVLALHTTFDRFEQRLLLAAPPTLLHGDARLENLGLRDNRLVAVDWGECTGTGPAEMDLVWFTLLTVSPAPLAPTWRFDALPDEVFAMYEAHAARPLDPEALSLACLGLLAQAGCWATTSGMYDEAGNQRMAQLQGWFTPRVREALEIWSPV